MNGTAQAMKIDPEAAGMDAARLERITEHFEQVYIATGKLVGCQITVVRGGHVAYYRSLGNRDREQGLAVEDDTIWRIYSMTKPIASIALMQLYERGMFQLTDPVHRYIPEWRTLMVAEEQPDGSRVLVRPERPMQVRDVLMHMTGLPNWLFPVTAVDREFAAARIEHLKGLTLESLTAMLARFPLKFHPGRHWNYGLSTDIVGRLVEILSGRPFDEYLRAEVFEPLGMLDTGFFVPEADAGRLATLYQYQPGTTPRVREGYEQYGYLRAPTFLSGAGGLVSTTPDYVAFCTMLANGGQLDGRRVIGRKTLELMTCNHLPGGASLVETAIGGFGEAGFEGVGFGLGFAVGMGPAATAMAGSAGDFSWGGAASTAFWVDPGEDLFAVLMTQLFPSMAYPIRAQLRALAYQAIEE
ncbi:MAG TPA: serine hydrolase domain-containing protein [Acidimicrobiales bacterium]|nr:serine hydrolase domain-containing protein [Acidimicrobiales bacterium]